MILVDISVPALAHARIYYYIIKEPATNVPYFNCNTFSRGSPMLLLSPLQPHIPTHENVAPGHTIPSKSYTPYLYSVFGVVARHQTIVRLHSETINKGDSFTFPSTFEKTFSSLQYPLRRFNRIMCVSSNPLAYASPSVSVVLCLSTI